MSRIYVTSDDEDGLGVRGVVARSPGRYLSCARCGKIGHVAENCKEALQSLESMWAGIAVKIEQAESMAPSEWKRDEYGLYLPGQHEIGETESFFQGRFCFNCGRAGHTLEECKMPTRRELTEKFGDCKNTSQSTRMRRREVIDLLKKEYAMYQ